MLKCSAEEQNARPRFMRVVESSHCGINPFISILSVRELSLSRYWTRTRLALTQSVSAPSSSMTYICRRTLISGIQSYTKMLGLGRFTSHWYLTLSKTNWGTVIRRKMSIILFNRSISNNQTFWLPVWLRLWCNQWWWLNNQWCSQWCNQWCNLWCNLSQEWWCNSSQWCNLWCNLCPNNLWWECPNNQWCSRCLSSKWCSLCQGCHILKCLRWCLLALVIHINNSIIND
jgi:hypothetical protein